MLDGDADGRGGGWALAEADRSGGRQCLTPVCADYAEITELRATDPAAIERAWQNRNTRPTVRGNGRLMIVAADHPARGALAVGSRPTAMNSRTDLLETGCGAALADPGVDGVLATADILDDLVVACALDRQGGVLVDEPRVAWQARSSSSTTG